MLSLAVIGWQITIVFTLALARLFGGIFNKPDAVYWVCGCWILFTFVGVFYEPLILVQLMTIFWATGKFAPDQAEKHPEETAQFAQTAVQTDDTHVDLQCLPQSKTPKTREDFRMHFDSPAEEAFLDIMVRHYELKPVDDCLMGRGITLELQYPIDKCRADFLINDCLIVEIDGAAYHSSKQAKARDTRRDKFIRRQGYHILRIPAKYPLYRTSATINKVKRAISIVATGEVTKKYAEEDRFFHSGAEDCGLRYKSTPSGLFKATQETLLRNNC